MGESMSGPVSVGEVQMIISQLGELAARAGEAGQGGLGMVCGLAAESLADNLSMVMDCGDE